MSSCLYSTRWNVIGRASRPVVGCSYVGVFPGVFLYGRHPRFRDFDPVVPVDVVRVEADLDRFLDSVSVPVWISVNALDIVPAGAMSGRIGVFRYMPQRSDSARGVRLSRAPSSSPALVFPSPRCIQRRTRHVGSCIPPHLVFREGLGPSAAPGGSVELCWIWRLSVGRVVRGSAGVSVKPSLRRGVLPWLCGSPAPSVLAVWSWWLSARKGEGSR